jgi:hypothetical protein
MQTKPTIVVLGDDERYLEQYANSVAYVLTIFSVLFVLWSKRHPLYLIGMGALLGFFGLI